MSSANDLRLTAYHEIGHVVVGYALGLEVQGVTIVPTDDCLGLADVPVDLEMLYGGEDEYAEKHLACYFAGAVAEEILTGEEVEFVPGGCYGGDWNGAADCVVEIAGRDQDLQVKVSEREYAHAREILQQSWDSVDRFAETLLSQERLSRPEILNILREAGA